LVIHFFFSNALYVSRDDSVHASFLIELLMIRVLTLCVLCSKKFVSPLVQKVPIHWDLLFKHAEWVHNSTKHESLNCSHFGVVTGLVPIVQSTGRFVG
jgi:hypothetical protein